MLVDSVWLARYHAEQPSKILHKLAPAVRRYSKPLKQWSELLRRWPHACLHAADEPSNPATANNRPSTSAGIPCCCNELPLCEHSAPSHYHAPAIPPKPNADHYVLFPSRPALAAVYLHELPFLKPEPRHPRPAPSVSERLKPSHSRLREKGYAIFGNLIRIGFYVSRRCSTRKGLRC